MLLSYFSCFILYLKHTTFISSINWSFLFLCFLAELHKKETCEAATIIEAPPMVVIGVVGYVKTSRGLRSLNTVWAQHLSEEVKRRFYKNWYRCKKKAFSKYVKKYETDEGKKEIQAQLEKMKKYASVVRVLAHTQVILLLCIHSTKNSAEEQF